MAESTELSAKGLIGSDRIEGTPVYTVDGKHIGAVKRFMIDRKSGKIAYVVMSFGGFLDFGQETYTIPWARLRFNAELEAYETDITASELESVPPFAHSEETVALDEAQEEELHAHFRIPPYWRGAI